MTALAAFSGAVFGLGLFLLIAALTGADLGTGRFDRFRRREIDRPGLRIAGGAAAALIAALATRWPVLVVAAAVAGAWAPSLPGRAAARTQNLRRSEAVAAWTEMLRDTMAAAAGLNDAILASVPVAPPEIATEVAALAARSEHQPLGEALRRFALDLDDPVADATAAALILSNELQAKNLGAVLGEIASHARDRVAMHQRIEASRARTYASARFVVIVTVSFAVGVVLFARDYLEPFDEPVGQLVLGVVLALFAGSAWSLRLLGRSPAAPRIFVATPDEVS